MRLTLKQVRQILFKDVIVELEHRDRMKDNPRAYAWYEGKISGLRTALFFICSFNTHEELDAHIEKLRKGKADDASRKSQTSTS